MDIAIAEHPNGGFLIAKDFRRHGEPYTHDGNGNRIPNPRYFEDYATFWTGTSWEGQKRIAMKFPTQQSAETYVQDYRGMLTR
jgi:hypothetical protein